MHSSCPCLSCLADEGPGADGTAAAPHIAHTVGMAEADAAAVAGGI